MLFQRERLVVSGVSTLIMKYAVSKARISPPLSRSELHSAVQPP